MSGLDDNIAFVRCYREAFTTFDPDIYAPMLAKDPVYHAGMTMRRGAKAYHQNSWFRTGEPSPHSYRCAR